MTIGADPNQALAFGAWCVRDYGFDYTGGRLRGTVQVLNLIEGQAVVVKSPDRAFKPFTVHYAETFVVPAAVGSYTIEPHPDCAGQPYAVLKAFVGTGL